MHPGGSKSGFRALCHGRKNTAAMWHKVLKGNSVSRWNQRGSRLFSQNSSWCVVLPCAYMALDSSPGFCSVVLSLFPSQFSRARAPGVALSFKQVCAHIHFLLLRCSPDLDNSLLPAVLCQPPPQPATLLSRVPAPSQLSCHLVLLYSNSGKVSALRKRMQAQVCSPLLLFQLWTEFHAVKWDWACPTGGGAHKKKSLCPRKLMNQTEGGWEGKPWCRHWRQAAETQTEGSTVFPNLMQRVHSKFKHQPRLPVSGPQPHKSSFRYDEWGERVPYQLALSGMGWWGWIRPRAGHPGGVRMRAGVGWVGGSGQWEGCMWLVTSRGAAPFLLTSDFKVTLKLSARFWAVLDGC